MNENFDLENHLPQQMSAPLPPYQCFFATKKTLMNPSSFQTTLSERRVEKKHFCDNVCLSMHVNRETLTQIAFVLG